MNHQGLVADRSDSQHCQDQMVHSFKSVGQRDLQAMPAAM